MTTPRRIRLSRARGWKLPDNAVNVARPGPLGNPFVVGKDGTRAECAGQAHQPAQQHLVEIDAATIEAQRAARTHVAKHLDELRGKDLACWCRLDGGPCHADVLIEMANR